MLSYRGYDAEVSFSDGDRAIHGVVINIADTIHFQGQTPDDLVAAFHESVDDYLAWCEAEGRAPAKPYSGTFLVRMDPDLHRRAALKAGPRKLNAFVVAAVERALVGGASGTTRTTAKPVAKRQVAKTPVEKKPVAKKRVVAKKVVKTTVVKPAAKRGKSAKVVAATRRSGQSRRIGGEGSKG